MRTMATITTLICTAVAMPIWAIDLPIANAGFEQAVLPCSSDCFVASSVPGWTGTGVFGTSKPTIGSQGSHPFLSAVPEGTNTAYLAGSSERSDGTITQALTASLQPNMTYTLTYSVGALANFSFTGYRVELLAGSTVLATDSSLAPASGTFMTGRVVYSSTNAIPALLGQTLGIRLTGYYPGQAHFDKLSLDATPVVLFSSASQIASGGGWKTTLTLVNLSLTQNTIRIAVRGDDGHQLTLPLVATQQGTPQAVTAASVERTVEPGATLLIESEAPSSSATLVGWAEVISSGPVSGFAIFRQRGQDGRDAEGTAPVESIRTSSLIVPFDNTAGFVTGVALVNLTTQAVIITATIRDDNGAQTGLQAVALPAMGHTSFSVPDRFSMTASRRGTIEFRNTDGGTLTGLGLRFSGSIFTSIPVIAR